MSELETPELSIVTTLYRSEAFVREFYVRVTAAATVLGVTYEIVLVDDGSPDSSLAQARDLAKMDRRVRVIELSRNFGHHIAAFAAIEAARGRRVFLIDSDLEESPEWLLDFAKAMDSENVDVVYGIQTRRAHGLGSLFYRVFNALSDTQIPENACTVRLMRRNFVDALTQMHDRKLFMAGMFMWAGFRQLGVPVAKGRRRSGKSSYTLGRQVALFVDAITSFSSKPLYAAFFVGLAIASTAGLLGSFLIIRKLLFPEAVLAGFTALMVSITFIGGLIILFLGIIGVYLAKIFAEVKDRPLYVTRSQQAPRMTQAETTDEPFGQSRRVRPRIHTKLQVRVGQ